MFTNIAVILLFDHSSSENLINSPQKWVAMKTITVTLGYSHKGREIWSPDVVHVWATGRRRRGRRGASAKLPALGLAIMPMHSAFPVSVTFGIALFPGKVFASDTRLATPTPMMEIRA
jgi:hypothetical protein